MKYFVNINNAEDLKKRFRELSITLHPDRGGNAEDFAAMLAEYETAAKNLNAWTKAEREEVAGIVRGMRVYYFGYGMNCTEYVITKIEGDAVHMVRTFGHDFSSAEDMEYYDNDAFRTSQARYIKPVSKKFGIGYYWDDENGLIYTESEIRDFVSRANNFVHWFEIYEADKKRKEDEEKAKREAAERLIINKWRKLLRTIPEGAKDATRKAALKNNVKVIFNHYFPGVKVSVSDTSKCWCESSSITWTDGPTVEEVENIEELRYFIARYYEVDPNADYGDYHRCECWQEWRELFGAWSDDRIKYERVLSPEAAAAFRADIEKACPQFAGVADDAEVTITDEGHDTDINKILDIIGLQFISVDYSTATDEEKNRANKREEARRHINNCIGHGWKDSGVKICFRVLLRYCSEYYKMSEKSEEPQPEQPQTQSTEGAQPQSVEGVELVELDGGRIAVTGETYEHRATLKAFGGWWNRREQRWEFKPAQAQSVREWLGMGDNAHTEPQSDTESANTTQTESNTTDTPTEPQSAQDEPQPEPQPEEPTEGAKGATISEGLAGAFAKVAAIVAAVVMVATSSAAQPEPQPQSDKGAKIVFSSSDTPELQEIQTETQTDTRTQPEPAAATAAPSDRLDALNLARLKAQKLTEDNEHTQSLFAELEALQRVGVDVSDILRDLHALDAAHVKRGYITAGEIQMRQFMREFAINRAAARLSDNEFIALFGKGKQAA
jgi:hypothetical protein